MQHFSALMMRKQILLEDCGLARVLQMKNMHRLVTCIVFKTAGEGLSLEDCKCSTSMTARIDVTDLVQYSRKTQTKFYINFLYILSKVLNSRDDYKMGYLWQTDELICYDSINPTQYVFHEDTETCTPVYTTYYEDYERFYKEALADGYLVANVYRLLEKALCFGPENI